jgi:S-adenosylmethionine:tRNA ribosyltransferase-isomerase
MDTILREEYSYDLPQDKIALYPLVNRDDSKLLVYNRGAISHQSFKSLPDTTPNNAILFFNDTKVVPARIYFKKETGGEIEIFLLNPIEPTRLMVQAMNATRTAIWICTIGNLKRWNENTILRKNNEGISIEARLVDRVHGKVEFKWTPANLTFAEIISTLGVTPLPPYLKRDAESKDAERYQTIYSHYDGAVAAPTVGLHFTESVLHSLQEKGIDSEFLTLHVSAGTFQPIKVDNVLEHAMHEEQVVISKGLLEKLRQENKFILPVGTTSMRTLESIYWYGVKILKSKENNEFKIDQNDPYLHSANLPTKMESIDAVLGILDSSGAEYVTGNTSIFIRPGYQFKICNGLITNFHLPASTLILLVAALIGEDWRKVYESALANNYRFLSYGDSSLLIP